MKKTIFAMVMIAAMAVGTINAHPRAKVHHHHHAPHIGHFIAGVVTGAIIESLVEEALPVHETVIVAKPAPVREVVVVHEPAPVIVHHPAPVVVHRPAYHFEHNHPVVVHHHDNHHAKQGHRQRSNGHHHR